MVCRVSCDSEFFSFQIFFSFRVISDKLEVSVHSDLRILYEGLGGAIS